jgi:hypothetical protein
MRAAKIWTVLLGSVLIVALTCLAVGYSRLSRELRALQQSTESGTDRSAQSPPGPLVAAAALAISHAALGSETRPSRDPPVTAEPLKADPPPPLTTEERLSGLQAAFDRELEDRAWASSNMAKLEQGLRRVANSQNLKAIECKSSLCRVNYVTDDASECETFSSATVHQSPPYFWEGPYVVTQDPSHAGPGCRFLIYLAREGIDLASLH